MNTAVANADNETVRRINRHLLKFVAIRVVTPIAVTVAATLIGNAIEKKLDAVESSEETTD